jgi:hypothetical protein
MKNLLLYLLAVALVNVLYSYLPSSPSPAARTPTARSVKSSGSHAQPKQISSTGICRIKDRSLDRGRRFKITLPAEPRQAP